VRVLLVLQAQGKVNDVYTTCSTILTELGETIPESYTFTMASKQMTATLNAYEKVGENFIKGEKTVDKTLYKTLQFYNVIALASYFCKSYSMVIYFTCKAVQLSLQRGLCEHTASALIQFTSVVTKEDNAALC
jgi:cytidylate kinase